MNDSNSSSRSSGSNNTSKRGNSSNCMGDGLSGLLRLVSYSSTADIRDGSSDSG